MSARRVLVVDDNPAFADNLAEILRDEGAEVTVALDAATAAAQVRDGAFDVMLTDMRMPGANGATLLHQVRALDPGLPAILITAFSGEDAVARAQNEGVLAVLPKPVPVSQLCQLVAVARRGGFLMLIEDERRLSERLEPKLRQRGFTTFPARRGVAAEPMGAAVPFAVVVDAHLPVAAREARLGDLRKLAPDLAVIVTGGDAGLSPGPSTEREPTEAGAVMEQVEHLYARRSQ